MPQRHAADAFWITRAVEAALRVGPEARAAVVVREGRLLTQVVHARTNAPELTAIIEASPRAAGATLYLPHHPDLRAVDLASRTRVARLVLAPGVALEPSELRAWRSAGLDVDHLRAL